jgi:probable rRNA maturation factor
VGVVFVGPRAMRTLNQEYRGKDYATDVLSFPYESEIVDGVPFLGEIVIAPAVAERQAHEYRTTLKRETRRLLVHGLLHLLGYDHEVDNGEMLRLQARLLKKSNAHGHRPTRETPKKH